MEHSNRSINDNNYGPCHARNTIIHSLYKRLSNAVLKLVGLDLSIHFAKPGDLESSLSNLLGKKSLLDILAHPRLKSFRFLFIGGLFTVYAYALNIALVEMLRLDKGSAYALVLASQMFLGLLVYRYLVFDRGASSLARISIKYFSAALIIRGANWTLYTLLNTYVFVSRAYYYIVSQSICVALFLALKYFVFKRIFEAGRESTNNSNLIV